MSKKNKKHQDRNGEKPKADPSRSWEPRESLSVPSILADAAPASPAVHKAPAPQTESAAVPASSSPAAQAFVKPHADERREGDRESLRRIQVERDHLKDELATTQSLLDETSATLDSARREADARFEARLQVERHRLLAPVLEECAALRLEAQVTADNLFRQAQSGAAKVLRGVDDRLAEAHIEAEARTTGSLAESAQMILDAAAKATEARQGFIDALGRLEVHVADEMERQLESLVKRSDLILSDAADDAGNIRVEAEKNRANLLTEARAEAERIRGEALMEAARTRGQADEQARLLQAEAASTLADAQSEAGRVRDQALVAGTRATQKADEQARTTIGEADATLSSGRTEAERIKNAARTEASEEASRILIRAADEAESERASRLAAVVTREREAAASEDRAAERLAQSEAIEADVARREADLARRILLADHRDTDLDRMSETNEARAQVLAEATARLDATHVQSLETLIAELQQRLKQAQVDYLRVSGELDRIRVALDEAGGEQSLQLLREVERLRADNDRLIARVAALHDDEEVRTLNAEVTRLTRSAQQAADLRHTIEEITSTREAAEDHSRQLQDQLRRLEKERDRLSGELREVQHQRDDLESLQGDLEAREKEMEVLRTRAAWLETLNADLHRDLNDRVAHLKTQSQRTWGTLADLDEPGTFENLPPVADPSDLKTLATQLKQDMAANGRRYDDHIVRAFLAGMASSWLILLKGISGTGKTSLPLYAAKALQTRADRVPVQCSWRDRSELLGTYNPFSREFRAAPFTEAVYRANLPNWRDRPVFVILDEANISRVEYYLADLLSEMESEIKDDGWHEVQLLDQPLPHPPGHLVGGRRLKIPANVWIVLTANEDESTFELADKTCDRAAILQMDEKAPPDSGGSGDLAPVSYTGLRKLFRAVSNPKAKTFLDANGLIMKLEGTLRKALNIGYGNRFEPQLMSFLGVYVAAGGSPTLGLDHFVRTKILRKVERIRDPGLRPSVEKVRDTLQKEWPFRTSKILMPQCDEALSRLLERLA